MRSMPFELPAGFSDTNVTFQPRSFARWAPMCPNWAGKFLWTKRTCTGGQDGRLRGFLTLSVTVFVVSLALLAWSRAVTLILSRTRFSFVSTARFFFERRTRSVAVLPAGIVAEALP